MRETGKYGFTAKLVKELKELFPGCIVLHNDPQMIQGIPDLVILFEDRWAALESKAWERARRRPNQEHYVNLLDDMSFAAFISPDNKEEVLYGLQLAFGTRR